MEGQLPLTYSRAGYRYRFEQQQVEERSKAFIESKKMPTILIIDNQIKNVVKLKMELQLAGYRVIVHTNSLGMMGTIMEERPDLILLDIKMPLLDGQMLCRLIKRNQQLAKTHILLYSALTEKQLCKKVVEYQAQDYIPKSWAIEQVIYKVSQYLSPALI
jgi:two-component system, OmpR family, alkaline phosphatase synthesis response regulator PhoP